VRAVAWVARKTKPVRVSAEELGMPRKTRYRWMEATRQHPTEPFVGHGPRRGEDQRRRDLERAVHDLAEENAILKKSDAPRRPRPAVRFAFIHDHRFDFSVTKMC